MSDKTGTIWTIEALRARRSEILSLAERYGAYNVRVFGSVARGEATPESDVDLLVRYRPGTSLWDAVGLWQDLQELLGCAVSVVDEDDQPRRQRFLRRAFKDAVPLDR